MTTATRTLLSMTLLTIALLAMTTVAVAQPVDPTRTMTIQGTVLTSGGPVVDDTYGMVFHLYAAQTGGSPLYSHTAPAVVVSAGVFDAEIGPVPEGVLEGADIVWLETVVEGTTLPRRPVRPVAYSLVAKQATRALLAVDVSCSGCVGATDVDFPFAGAASKGGPALDVDCTGCIASSDIASGAIATGHLQDGAVTPAKAGFAWAGANTAGGAAKDLVCTGCVGSSDLASSIATGQLSADGAVYACTGGAPGCSVFVADAALAEHGDGWLSAQAASGLRVRSPANDAWRPVEFGGGTSFGSFAVSGGNLGVSGALDVGQALTTAGARIGPTGAGLLVTDGTGTTPQASALFEVRSSTKGFLPPRVTTAQRNAIGGATPGLVVFNTTTDALQTYTSGGWADLGSGSSQPLLTAGPTVVANGQSLVLTHNLGTLNVLASAWVQASDGKWDAVTGSENVGAGVLTNVAAASNGGSCIAQSSAYQGSGINGSYGCSNLVDGGYNDGSAETWATNGQGVGSYVTLKLNKLYQLRRVGYKQRGCACEWNKDLRLDFSNGTQQVITLAYSLGPNQYDITPVVANQVTITVLNVYSTVNNGASEIELWGTDPPKDLRVRKTANTVEIQNQSGESATLHLVVAR